MIAQRVAGWWRAFMLHGIPSVRGCAGVFSAGRYPHPVSLRANLRNVNARTTIRRRQPSARCVAKASAW